MLVTEQPGRLRLPWRPEQNPLPISCTSSPCTRSSRRTGGSTSRTRHTATR
jgi:hypothetical protein